MELPIIFTYWSRHLRDPELVWWVLAYPELTMKAVDFFSVEVYELCRLWGISRELIPNMSQCDLLSVLVSSANADECERLILVIGNVVVTSAQTSKPIASTINIYAKYMLIFLNEH